MSEGEPMSALPSPPENADVIIIDDLISSRSSSSANPSIAEAAALLLNTNPERSSPPTRPTPSALATRLDKEIASSIALYQSSR